MQNEAPQTTRTRIAVVDLDGTVADCSHRLHALPKGEITSEADWKLFYRLLHYDKPMKDHIQFIKRYVKQNDMRVVFVTGRNILTEKDSEEFVKKYLKFAANWTRWGDEPNIRMRAKNDRRPAWKVKRDHLHDLLDNFAVQAVFEDNKECLEMYAEELLKYSYNYRIFTPTPEKTKYKHTKSPFLLFIAGELWEYKKSI